MTAYTTPRRWRRFVFAAGAALQGSMRALSQRQRSYIGVTQGVRDRMPA